MISSCLAREETMDDFWPLGISSHGKEEIWFVKVPANGIASWNNWVINLGLPT